MIPGSRIDSVTALFLGLPPPRLVGGDEYGRQEAAPRKPRPYLLDMLLDEQPRSSARRSRLLRLPDHILADIVDYLMSDADDDHDDASRRALRALALTNSACRHLAHAARFCCIVLDYSERARQLAQALVDEANGTNTHTTLRLRPYIRHATFSPRRRHVIARHRTLFDISSLNFADRLGLPGPDPLVNADPETAAEAALFREQLLYRQEREKQQELEKEAGIIYGTTRDTAVAALASLPTGLHTLVWSDAVGAGLDVFQTLATIPAQHVRIQNVSMAENVPWATPFLPTTVPTSTSWPIRSLTLNARFIPFVLRQRGPPGLASASDTPHPASPAYAALFQMCAPTLESLYWTLANPLAPTTPRVAIGDPPPAFPRLHSLQLNNIAVDETTLRALLAAPRLRHLALSSRLVDQYAHLLPELQPRLYSFVARAMPVRDHNDPGADIVHIARFLQRFATSDGLTKLSLGEVEPWGRRTILNSNDSESESENMSLLDRHIVPLLGQTRIYDGTRGCLFRSLRSLSLEWWCQAVPESALAVIGTLTALTQLSLGGGRPPMTPWLVDHAVVQHHLRGLSLLKTLAIVHDTYPIAERPPPSPNTDTDTDTDTDTAHTPPAVRGPDYYANRYVSAAVRADADARILPGDHIDIALDNMGAPGWDEDSDDNTRFRFRALRWHAALLQDDSRLDTTWRDRIHELSVARDRQLNSVRERAHRNRMLAHAERYAEVLPALAWIYIGQRPIGIARDQGVHAFPLTDERDACTALLESTFGLPGGR